MSACKYRFSQQADMLLNFVSRNVYKESAISCWERLKYLMRITFDSVGNLLQPSYLPFHDRLMKKKLSTAKAVHPLWYWRVTHYTCNANMHVLQGGNILRNNVRENYPNTSPPHFLFLFARHLSCAPHKSQAWRRLILAVISCHFSIP